MRSLTCTDDYTDERLNKSGYVDYTLRVNKKSRSLKKSKLTVLLN